MISLLKRLWDMIRSWFGLTGPTRKVARLAAHNDESATLATTETIDLSGKPLKTGHLRRALRDPRLLPKKKSILSSGKKQKLMTHCEATRLFSGTQRTRRRDLRDLLADEDQLARYGLPVWRSEQEVARALGISEGELRGFATHRERERVAHYVVFAIPKRSGGERLIMAPKRRLKAIQRRLSVLLVDKLPVSEDAHGFRKGRSIRTNALPHVGQKLVLKLDLAEFFPSVSFSRVRGLLVALGYGYPVATCLAVLMTEAERQPVEIDGQIFHVPVGPRYCVQGAPTSPGLCNAIVLRLDRRLAGLAKRFGGRYTRYADDLSFSGNLDRSTANRLRVQVQRVISAMSW